MKPSVLDTGIMPDNTVSIGNLAAFTRSDGNEVTDSGIEAEKAKKLVEKKEQIEEHLENYDGHVSPEDREKWNKRDDITIHAANDDIHVSKLDREKWNEKETPEGAQAKADAVMTHLNTHIYNSDIHVTQADKNKLDRVYSKEEVDQLFSQFNSKTVWKESVNTYTDIFRVYPDPYDGWTVNVLDSDLTYKFDGTEWICVSANVIPNASVTTDGKMSKEDKMKLDTIALNANYYVHPNDPFTRHVTDEQIRYWTNKASMDTATYTDIGLMLPEDKYKLDHIDNNANYYEHPATHSARMIDQTDDLQFVTKEEKDKWTAKAENRIVTHNVNGLMTPEDKTKLDTIADNANNYVHPEKHYAKMIEEDDVHRFVTDVEKETWNAKLSRSDFIVGSSVFNGNIGTKINHDLSDPTTSYIVTITVTSSVTPDKIGTIFVEKYASYFLVFSSGGNLADTFDYMIYVPSGG